MPEPLLTTRLPSFGIYKELASVYNFHTARVLGSFNEKAAMR